jgi:transcriptional regulator with XRE-family HTH domain
LFAVKEIINKKRGLVVNKEIGKKIKSLRLAKSQNDGKMYTKKMLHEDAGISYSYICDIESGRYDNPGYDILEKIAKALDASVFDILEETNDIPINKDDLPEPYKKIGVEKAVFTKLLELSDDELDYLVQVLKSFK